MGEVDILSSQRNLLSPPQTRESRDQDHLYRRILQTPKTEQSMRDIDISPTVRRVRLSSGVKD